jgi:hypothetical protein
MKRSKYLVTLGLAGALGMSEASAAQNAPPAPPQRNEPARGVAADQVFQGKVDRVDLSERRVQVTDSDGAQKIFHWDDATAMKGAELREGASVSVNFRERSGKAWATAIRVGETA